MPGELPTSNRLLEMAREGALFPEGTILEGAEGIDQIAELLAGAVTPDFVTVMHSESAVQEYRGMEGFREALTDWISPYERFRLTIDEAVVKDDKLVFLVRQLATTKHDRVEVETHSGTVWWLRDGMITQAVFYLDQQSALRAAGVDPERDRPSEG